VDDRRAEKAGQGIEAVIFNQDKAAFGPLLLTRNLDVLWTQWSF